MVAPARASGPSYERVHDAVTLVTGTRERSGPGYVNVCCPAHPDSEPSCTLRYDPSRGKTTVHCQAGCDDADVLSAIGLSTRDLFDEPRAKTAGRSTNGLVKVDPQRGTGKATAGARRASGTNGGDAATAASPSSPTTSPGTTSSKDDTERWELVCRYVYQNHDGTPVGRVSRFRVLDAETGEPIIKKNGSPKKTFAQHRHDGQRWRSGGFGPVLYRLPEIAAAIAAGEPIYLVEGEKDADTAAEQFGVAGTTAGNAGKFTGQHADQLRGAAVVLVADDDLPGYRHATHAQQLLDGTAASVACYAPAAGKDLTDHAQAGHGLAELIPINPAAKVEALAPATPPPDGPDQTDQGGDDQPAGDPQFNVPMSAGRWAYSTGDGTDGFNRGLYRLEHGEWLYAAPVPYVLERLVQRAGDGTPREPFYRIATRPVVDTDEPDGILTVSDETITKGKWAQPLGVELTPDPKILQAVTGAIRHTALHHAQHRDLVPRWTKTGELVMPTPDVGPAGYAHVTDDEATATAAWGEISEIASRAPKLALTLGASLAAGYVAPLRLLPCVWYCVGQAQRGKTTALDAGAAIWGDRENIVGTWDMSAQAAIQHVADLGVVPAFMDEKGSGRQSSTDTQAMILSLTGKGKRKLGTIAHRATSTAGWRSTLFASGNPSILGQLSDEALAARVVEIPPPITATADDSRRLCKGTENPTTGELLEEPLLDQAAGWVQHWLRTRENGMDVPGFRALRMHAIHDLNLADGGVERALGEHYALAVAGVARLEELLGTSGLREIALAGAREQLDKSLDELAERGMSPAERVYRIATQAQTARPGAYPTLADYRRYLTGPQSPDEAPVLLPREVEGLNISDDPAEPGDLAVFTGMLGRLCRDAEMTESPTVGLRELRDDGRLARPQEKGKLSRRIRIGGKRHIEVYAFYLTDDDEAAPGDDGTGTTPTPAPGDDELVKPDKPGDMTSRQSRGQPGSPPNGPVPSDNGAAGAAGVTPASGGVTPVDPGVTPAGHTGAGVTPDTPVTSRNGTGEDRPAGGDPGDPGRKPRVKGHVRHDSQDNPAEVPDGAVVITAGADGPVWLTSTHAPCRVCGAAAPSADPQGVVHAVCAMPPDQRPAPAKPVEPDPAQPASEDAAEPAELSVPADRAQEGICPVCGGRSTLDAEGDGTWRHVTCTEEHATVFGTPYPPEPTPDMDSTDTAGPVETDTPSTGDTQDALGEPEPAANPDTDATEAREAADVTGEVVIDPDQMMLPHPDEAERAEHTDADGTASSDSAEATTLEEPAEPDSATQQTVKDESGLALLAPVPTSGPRPAAPEPYRAACTVADPSGIYLPDGARYQPPTLATAADVLTLGETLNLGHPHGPGQVVLTDAMCEHLGLVAEPDPGTSGDEARGQITNRLAALDQRFLAPARTAGWEAPSLRVETRARRNGRVLDIVLAPYEHLWSRGREDSHPTGTLPDELTPEQYAAESARLMGYLASLLDGPWRSSTVEAGWDTFTRAQKARSRHRGHVLTRPARLPELTGGTDPDGITPAIAWPHRPTEAWTPSEAELAHARWVVRLDRRMAWLASAARTDLGYLTDDHPEMAHHTDAEHVRELLAQTKLPAGLWRIVLPAATPGTPPIHGAQSYQRPRLLWVTTPTVETLLADDDPTASLTGAGCSPAELTHDPDGEPAAVECYLFPAQGRLLGSPFSDTLRDARYHAAAHRDRTVDDLLKRVYAGCLQTSQNTSRRVIDGPRGWHHQATWLATVKAAHYQRQSHLLRQATYTGNRPLGVEIDEVAFLTREEPAAFRLGNRQTDTPDGDVRMGQYRIKAAVELTDELREQIRTGTSVFHLSATGEEHANTPKEDRDE